MANVKKKQNNNSNGVGNAISIEEFKKNYKYDPTVQARSMKGKNIEVKRTNSSEPKDVRTVKNDKKSANEPSFGKKVLQTGANLLSGSGKGVQGIVDVPFQEIENNLQKGEQTTKEPIKESLKTLGKMIAPGVAEIASIPGRIKENVDTLKDKDKTFWQKLSGLGKTGLKNTKDSLNAINPVNTSEKGAIETVGRSYKGLTGKNASKNVEKAQKVVDSPFDKYSEKVAKENSKYGKKEQFIFNVAGALGNMAPSTAASIITKNPEIGLAAMGVSARGQATEEARKKGMNLDDAIDVGNVKGAIEIATEKLTGGVNVFGKGALDDIVERGIDKAVKKKVLNFLAKKGVGVAGEIVEETISDILNTAIDKGTVDPNAKYDIKDWSDTAATTALTTLVLNALGGGYTPRAYNQNVQQMQVQDIINQKNEGKIDAGQANEMIKQVQEGTYEQNQAIDKIAQEKVNEISNNPNLTQGQKADMINAVTQTLEQQRANINSNVQNTLNNDSLEQNNINNQEIQNSFQNSNIFSKQVDDYINGTFNKNNHLTVLEHTPEVLQKIGVADLPITLTANKLDRIMNDSGKQKGEYHGLHDLVKKLPDAIQNPLDIIKSHNNSYVLTTDISDNQDRSVIISLKINGRGNIDNVEISTNVMTSAYGRNNYDNWMKKHLENGDIVYDIDRGVIKPQKKSVTPGLQLPSDNTSTDNISKNSKKVNDTSSVNSMQQNSSNDTISEKRAKAEQILRINENGTAEEISDRPKILDKMPDNKKAKKTLKEQTVETAILFTNKNAELDRISKKVKNNMLKTETDRLGLAPAEAQQNIGDSQRNNDGVLYKNFTNKDGSKVSMSLDGIWDDANDCGISNAELSEYLVANLNLDRLNQDVDQFNIPAYESEETIQKLEKKHPEIKRVAENIWQYQKNQLQKKVDAGLVSKDSQEYYNENTPHYVRIQRNVGKKGSNVMSAFNGNITMKDTIQNVKGSIENILPLRETMAQYEMESTSAIRKNNVLKELAKSLDYGEAIDKISLDGDLNINPELITKNDDGSYTATFFKDGQAYQIPINKGIYEALAGKTQYDWESWSALKIPKTISTVQRALLTDKNLIFMATNFFKDFGDAPLNSKYGTAKFLKNYPRAIADLFAIGKEKGNFSRLYEALGGSDNSYFKDGQFTKESKSKIGKAIDTALTPIEVGNEFIEKLPRLTEFMTTIESNGYTVNENGELVARKGKTSKKSSQEVLSEALYNAAEITTNFKRGGKVTKALNRNGATFLNASVQGFSKQIRNFTEIQNPKQAVKLLSKVVILGIAPALLNSAMYKDDKEYEDLPDYVKDEYYLFKGEDGKWIRIPKGRAVSVIGGAARHTKETVEGKEKASKAFGAWTDLAKTQIAPNSIFDSNVFAPISQVKKNKSWSGNKIVSDSLSNSEHPEEEYDAKTSSLSKWLGEKLNASPKKIDYLIDQYSGGIGDIVQPFMTNYAESDDDSTAGKLFLNPLKSKFTADSVYNNKTVSDFYDAMEKLESEKKYSKSTTTDKAKYSYMDSANKRIAELYKEQKTIQNNTSLTDSEKYKQARDKQKEIISAMKDAMDKVKDAKTKDGMTIIGNSYYKESKDEEGKTQTNKINDKTVNKANELGIDVDIYSEAVSDIYDIHDIKNSKGKVLKSRKQQVIEYIDSLKLTPAQKQKLYNQYYKK